MSAAQEVWQGYSDSIGRLTERRATLGEAAEAPGPTEGEVEDLLARSSRLEDALRPHLTADDPDVRQLAALQLQAASLMDLHVANQLAALDENGSLHATLAEAPVSGPEGEEATLTEAQTQDLDRILQTPTEQGILALVGPEHEGFMATAAEPAPLTDVVTGAVDGIAADAAKAAGTTSLALLNIPGDKLAGAFAAGVTEAFDKAGAHARWLKKKALEFVHQAITKLLAIFGITGDAVKEKVGKWIGEIDEKNISGFMLDRLYHVDDLKQRYTARIKGVSTPIPPERDEAARTALASLQAGWHKRAELIEMGAKVVGYARGWITGLAAPWGMLGYTAAMALATGYTVFAGGDYLDWRENDGILDLVPGVADVVAAAVGTGTR